LNKKLLNKNYLSKNLLTIQLFLFLTLTLNGCTNKTLKKEEMINNENKPIIEEEDISVLKNFEKEMREYELYVEDKNIKLGKYEPINGTYIGAYVENNSFDENEIEEFERLTKKKHLFYLYNLKLGDEFPENWILSCIANNKVPLITIDAPNEYDAYNKNLLIKTAKDFGTYDIPIFINFYPNANIKNYDVAQYTDFYKDAHSVFNQYIKKNVMIYSVSADNLSDMKKYYAGDDYVDWIGINIHRVLDTENEENIYGTDIFSAIDYFYYTFQESKPLMLSQFAVGNYSAQNNNYYTFDASKEIERVYSAIRNFYPRIKNINYVNDTRSDKENTKDNFSITENKTILKAYENTVALSSYLSKLQDNGDSDKSVLIKSPFKSYKIDNHLYISNIAMTYNLNFDENKIADSESLDIINIGDENYYNLSAITAQKYENFEIDERTKKIILK